jgi:glycosyltransferase involved in cell wall biosynthesis
MSISSTPFQAQFVVATPARSVCDENARALERTGALRFLALGTRRGVRGIPPERTRLLPAFGLANFAASKILSPVAAESFRFRMHPWFDAWVKKQLQPGDHVISSYGYANECFKFARAHGGKTFLDAGNSHPENFRAILSEEHRRWNSPHPPVAHHHHERSLAMMADVDFVLSPSSYVTKSFLECGFKPEQILKNVYPVDLSCFSPARDPRPASRPLTLICTGSLSLRKGTPYLLEAFRLVRKKIPDARLLLTDTVMDNAKPVLAANSDLPVGWSPSLPHPQLAQRLRSADIFVLPSLEEGLVRTACEAMACGLPAILTPNTGANDFIQPGVNGEVVPIRDPQAIADAVFKWAEKILSPGWQPRVMFDTEPLSFEHFEREFIRQLQGIGLV